MWNSTSTYGDERTFIWAAVYMWCLITFLVGAMLAAFAAACYVVIRLFA